MSNETAFFDLFLFENIAYRYRSVAVPVRFRSWIRSRSNLTGVGFKLSEFWSCPKNYGSAALVSRSKRGIHIYF